MPPFPGARLTAEREDAPKAEPVEGAARARLFGAICEGRVGGAFWAEPAEMSQSVDVVIRARTSDEAAESRAEMRDHTTLCIACESSRGALDKSSFDCPSDRDPWSVLSRTKRLIAHGDDEWVALAAITGIPVQVVSAGRFGSPGDDSDALMDLAAQELSQPVPDPFSAGWLDPLAAAQLLSDWRRSIDANRGLASQKIVAACGISWWKRDEIRRFLWVPNVSLRIVSNASRALNAAEAAGGALAIWPSRISASLVGEAHRRQIPLVRIEDGFVRSVGLGTNLVPPSSVIVDRRGIHYDPSGPSDLEDILATTEFTDGLLDRARKLRTMIVEKRISKYAQGSQSDTNVAPRLAGNRVVLVPGQVEDDMSVVHGGGGLISNLEVLKRVRQFEPGAEILWRPHPDVDAGHRKGAVSDADALEFADRIVRKETMADLLDAVDAVHVLTSLSGFEALLRGREVFCHGTPFYAGWGLTKDFGQVPERRGRVLTLDELVAGVLLLYPRYLDPVTGLPCPPEVLVERMAGEQMPNRQSWVEPIRRFQGKVMTRFRSQSGFKADT
ncbi:beta-3-deoxy-D-manno-oct-2-ulosonic acid transferase [Erythrobacter sp. WH131]|uniref:Beta-3-deoxy-D-manno-oct-2-ulosonic acid transferase n=2 Tax=Erythrobacter ani TaxID=2827235 RepID=A0ABS6SMR4_9SPHN|nr:beta-3-deoxy-D-manno-oct-2-ulosonic acid transferase [Erythrobacter ani]